MKIRWLLFISQLFGMKLKSIWQKSSVTSWLEFRMSFRSSWSRTFWAKCSCDISAKFPRDCLTIGRKLYLGSKIASEKKSESSMGEILREDTFQSSSWGAPVLIVTSPRRARKPSTTTKPKMANISPSLVMSGEKMEILRAHSKRLAIK